MNIKRNNPGNIRKDARWTWVGEQPGTVPGDFVQFDSLQNGYRAMMKDLVNKIKAGTDTIYKIIYKYAPPTDNNPTEAYIRFVANSSGIDKHKKLSATDAKQVGEIAYSMSLFEHGVTDDGTLQAALDKAKSVLFNIAETIKKNPAKSFVTVAVIGILIYLYFQNE